MTGAALQPGLSPQICCPKLHITESLGGFNEVQKEHWFLPAPLHLCSTPRKDSGPSFILPDLAMRPQGHRAEGLGSGYLAAVLYIVFSVC